MPVLQASRLQSGPKGKAVRIGHGRAAVTGDDRRNRPLSEAPCQDVWRLETHTVCSGDGKARRKVEVFDAE